MFDVAIKQRLVDVADALARVAGSLHEPSAVGSLAHLADEVHAVIIGMLAEVEHRTDVALEAGLSPELTVGLEGRQTCWDARSLVEAADALRLLPETAALLADGVVSASQVRAIARVIRPVRVEQRARVDELIASRAPVLVGAEPERLVDEVEDLVCGLREDLVVRREDRAIDRSFLALQQRFDGGGSLYGEADAESFATIAAALDAAADVPDGGEAEAGEPSSRARQRMDALVGVCEASLAGDGARGRPRARLLAVVDVTDGSSDAGARVLANVAGRPLRLSRLGTEALLCDADVTPIVIQDGQPIGVGTTGAMIPERVRSAVIARDGGCRFPGCRMPAAWSDVHHIRPRADGGDARVENLILLCRRCHRRAHRSGWRITFTPDGAATFTRRGHQHRTHPRARPARE